MKDGRTFFEYLFDDDEGPTPDAKLKGWLRKCKQTPNSFGKTTKRYFTLDMDELELCWFHSRSSVNPSGVIPLRAILSVKEISVKNGGSPGEFGIVVTSKHRTLKLLAATPKLATYWVKGLNLNLQRLKPVVPSKYDDEWDYSGKYIGENSRRQSKLPSDAIALMDKNSIDRRVKKTSPNINLDKKVSEFLDNRSPRRRKQRGEFFDEDSGRSSRVRDVYVEECKEDRHDAWKHPGASFARKSRNFEEEEDDRDGRPSYKSPSSSRSLRRIGAASSARRHDDDGW